MVAADAWRSGLSGLSTLGGRGFLYFRFGLAVASFARLALRHTLGSIHSSDRRSMYFCGSGSTQRQDHAVLARDAGWMMEVLADALESRLLELFRSRGEVGRYPAGGLG
jgi:hypothetical protein